MIATCVVHCLQQLSDQHYIFWFLLFQQAQLPPHILQVKVVEQIQVLVHNGLSPLWWQFWSKSLC